MFLNLGHQKLDIYTVSKNLVIESYKLTKQFPSEEKYAMSSQIRRASVSVLLNISEGSSRKSANERKRFYEIARGSVIEIDAALDAANGLHYLDGLNLKELEEFINSSFQLLSAMIKKL